MLMKVTGMDGIDENAEELSVLQIKLILIYLTINSGVVQQVP